MFSYIWPIALVVISNTLYQICAKSVPEGMNPLASLTVTYLIGAAVSCVNVIAHFFHPFCLTLSALVPLIQTGV